MRSEQNYCRAAEREPQLWREAPCDPKVNGLALLEIVTLVRARGNDLRLDNALASIEFRREAPDQAKDLELFGGAIAQGRQDRADLDRIREDEKA